MKIEFILLIILSFYINYKLSIPVLRGAFYDYEKLNIIDVFVILFTFIPPVGAVLYLFFCADYSQMFNKTKKNKLFEFNNPFYKFKK